MLTYNADGSTSITDAYNSTRTYTFSSILDIKKDTGHSQPGGSGCNAASSQIGYDSNGNISSRTDFNGHRINYSYDLIRNLELSRTEGLTETGVSTPETRTITTQWHDTFRLPVKVTEPGRETAWSYNNNGHLIQQTVTDTETGKTRDLNIDYTYSSQLPGAVLQKVVNGSRSDIADLTTFNYYSPDASCVGDHFGCRGQLSGVTNALGHTTQMTRYNAHGLLETVINPNDVVTTLTYDVRQRITRIDRNGQITQLQYDPVGQLIQMTEPGAVTLNYSYDEAQRLTAITDNRGNTVRYQLDAMGQRIKQEIKDPNGQLMQLLEREYDALGRLQLSIGGELQTRRFAYDANGNPTAVTDPRNTTTDRTQAKMLDPLMLDNTLSYTYDSLNRLTALIHPQQQATKEDDIVSTYHYDALDRPAEITDPNGLSTHYRYNAFGDVVQVNSPDTGITSYQYDDAGNLTSKTNANNITTIYRYDALNRLDQVDYLGKELDIIYDYDTCIQGIGRLCSVADSNSQTAYQYDSFGNRIVVTATIGDKVYNTVYSYDTGNNITSITYPSGRRINYERNELGQVIKVTHTDGSGSSETLASQIEYLPFGPLRKLLFGNGLTEQREYDLSYRLTDQITFGLQDSLYDYDSADNLLSTFQGQSISNLTLEDPELAEESTGTGDIAEIDSTLLETSSESLTTSASYQYVYDPLNRLTEESGLYGQRLYSYDANGNRLSRVDDQAANDYHYQDNSNRLIAIDQRDIELDAAGNTLSDHKGKRRFEYNQQERLFKVYHKNKLKAVYTYNAQGQRTAKDIVNKGKTKTIRYHYGQNGQLLSETQANGKFSTDYIWLNNRPVAQIKSKLTRKGKLKTAILIYLHTDHLNTPRTGTDKEGEIVWQWQSDAFGNALEVYAEDEHDELDDDKKARVEYTHHKKNKVNLRFPGQYYDSETGLHYNLNRYYSPKLGRYITSDPIGLQGGLNTYLYANANPLYYTDPYGLFGVADLPTLPQSAVNFSAGLGDALLLGFGDDLRNFTGVDGGVTQCSDAYRYGGYASLAVGGARLAYAGLAKGGSIFASSGASASAFRSRIKIWFRLGRGKNWRPPNLKGKTDAQLRVSAGKTNRWINAYGAGVTYAGATDGTECGCE